MSLDPDSVTSPSLLARVRDPDDEAAWEDFVDRYAPKIFAWCRQHRLQDSDAADVTQDVLCKLVAAMQRFQYDSRRGRFRGWLKTVTANAIHDLTTDWRRKGRAVGSTGVDGWLENLADESATDQLAELVESAYREELLSAASAEVR